MISDDGSYISTHFHSPKGTYVLVGSKSNGKLMDTMDTFKCNGEYFEWPRYKILDWFNEKKIWI